jgi:hypothetical protein
MNIANQGFPGFRADLNDALGALVSNSSGATAPATTFAHQFWVDTSANPSILKVRNADNDAFITIGEIDQTGDKFNLKCANATILENLTVNAQGDVRFADSDSSHFIAFQAPATVTSNVTFTLPAADGTNGQVIQTNGSGALSFATVAASPGGSNTQVQFNDSSSFGGDAGLTYNKTTDVLTVTGGAVLQGCTAGRGAGAVELNTAFGFSALNSNTTGTENTAIGRNALAANIIGTRSVAIGTQTLPSATAGANTAIGPYVGFFVTTGTKNLAIYGGFNGAGELSAGLVGTVTIGTQDAERIRVNTDGFLVPLVHSQTTGSAANVFVDTNGKMSRSTSSQRYKKNIQDAVHGLDKVLQLRPVTFNHINPDEDGIVYGGLIAEEVHDLGLTEFVEYTWDGKPDSLRYGHMVSVLVKAVQELNARLVALETQGA